MDKASNDRPIVLVVEDDGLLRLVSVCVFTDADFHVIEAVNAHRALECLRRGKRTHLLFTDIHMPGTINGLELAHLARKDWPSIGIIIVSGRSTLLPHELPIGARFHPKPYDPQKVIRHARELIAA